MALGAHGPDVVAAGAAIVDDLAHGRVIGKTLGQRNVNGDLTGLARVKFDVAGHRPQRFRLVYRQLDDTTREIIAIGPPPREPADVLILVSPQMVRKNFNIVRRQSVSADIGQRATGQQIRLY